MNIRAKRRQRIHFRIRKNVKGEAQKPRLSVYRSNSEIYVQLIDDTEGKTLASASSRDSEVVSITGNKSEKSKKVGEMIAGKAKELGIEKVVFDRSGYLYHGRIKALAEGAREGGLQF